MTYETIIIGAGFAGLAAARALKKGGEKSILLLEARDRVGGRAMPGIVAGVTVDFGGMWMGPTQSRLKQLASEFGVRTYRTNLEGKGVFRIGGSEDHGPGEDFRRLFNLFEGLDYLYVSRKIERLSATLECTSPWDHPRASFLDALTVEQWLQTNIRTAKLRSLFRIACTTLLCADTTQVSMLFFIHYIKSGDGLEPILSAGDGGAQHLLFEGGLHQIAQRMAQDVGDDLRLNDAVRSIEWGEGGVNIQSASGCHEAQKTIIAIPATMVAKTHFSPPLPRAKSALHDRISMGSAIKYWVAFESPFWRDAGFNGLIIRDDVPCAPCFDVTPPGAKVGLLAGFFDGDHAIDHGDDPREARKALVIQMLTDHFGEPALSPIDYVDIDWVAEEWSAGCYGAYAPPGVLARYGKWLRMPIGPLHWAGTESAARWTGYIEGAIRSGERAAEEVLAS
ncbi:flavin monoamine oxidase family protein [Erythrobacter sp.]|uniref:flavin monoamine oxidase family protein n=1 Tax=Erythrobacter sp. TaxID=1042 RepID=UPI003C73D8E7